MRSGSAVNPDMILSFMDCLSVIPKLYEPRGGRNWAIEMSLGFRQARRSEVAVHVN